MELLEIEVFLWVYAIVIDTYWARRPATVGNGVCKEKIDAPKVKKTGENRNE
jgi:hypothetical protein